MKTRLLLLALVVFAFALAGCTLEGGVEQGRAVAFESGKSLTLVLDTIRNAKTKKTSYTGKIETYALPDEKKDMGPEPTLGNLLAVDPAKGSVIVFDRRVGVRELAVNVTDKESIDNNRNPKVAGKKFPIID
jgi:hypothetical protein